MTGWCHRSANCADIPPDGSTVSSDHMAWLILGVLALVGLAAAVVVPRRARLGSAPGFPWFWVAFPVTCIVIATAIGVFAWPQVLTGSGSYWWEPPTANRPGSAVLVERAVPVVRDTAPVEMGAAGGIARGNRVVRVGLAAPPDVTPLLPKILQDTTEYLKAQARVGDCVHQGCSVRLCIVGSESVDSCDGQPRREGPPQRGQ